MRFHTHPSGMIALVLGCLAMAATAATAAEPLQPPYSWRGIDGSGVFPAGDLVTAFWDIPAEVPADHAVFKTIGRKLPEARPGGRRNVIWRTALPQMGFNTPVVMGDRVYLLCDAGWQSPAPLLICAAVTDGSILWQQPVDHLDAWPAAEQEEAKAMRAAEIQRWGEHLLWWNRFCWDNEANTPKQLDDAQWEKLRAEALKDGWDFPAADKRGKLLMEVKRGKGRTGVGPKDRFALPVDGERIANYRACRERGIWWHEGWESDGPWYGMVFGSVVGDGEHVYAATAFGGAAAFDTEGKRLWVASLPVRVRISANEIASPILAGDKLVYWHINMGTLYALDRATGKLAWSTLTPGMTAETQPKTPKSKNDLAGYVAHMAPNGTPVYMRIGDGTGGQVDVVIPSHGMVVRLADGKLLGMLDPPPGSIGKKGKPDPALRGSYSSWAARGDVLYGLPYERHLFAVRLSVQGDELKQEPLWQAKPKLRHHAAANAILYRDEVFAFPLMTGERKKLDGAAFSIADGSLVRESQARLYSAYDIGIGACPGFAITRQGWKQGYREDFGWMTFDISRFPGLTSLGAGALVQAKATGDMRERNIASHGTPEMRWGASMPVPWGNRIFIRSNHHLWCVGDPAAAWKPPEAYLSETTAR